MKDKGVVFRAYDPSEEAVHVGVWAVHALGVVREHWEAGSVDLVSYDPELHGEIVAHVGQAAT